MTLTREGFRLGLATLLVGLASLNTGNNLMYLILSVMLSIFFLSLVVTFINLKGIEISIEPVEELFAGRSSKIKIRYFKKGLFPSRSFFLLSMPEAPLRIFDYIELLKPEFTVERTVTITPLKRGPLNLKDFIFLKTGFPFIFTERTTRIKTEAGLLVYPALWDIEISLISPARVGNKKLTGEEEFQKIRPYRYGDDRRFIHWKATAKTGELMIKESALEETSRITILLDNFRPPDMNAFERSVSFAASLASKAIESGYYLRFVTCLKTLPFGTGREHLLKILDHLALIEPAEEFSCLINEKDIEGNTMLILQSGLSPLKKFTESAQRIFYASEI
ncbi:MAG: DUF58 domain-containing protein [Thermodesulfovibrionales bacterium]|nr:DUF58 domain-containing protein [Thermodesulfovibrionales bacterium]